MQLALERHQAVGQLGGLCVAWKSCVPFRSRSSRTPSLSGRLNTRSTTPGFHVHSVCQSTQTPTPGPSWRSPIRTGVSTQPTRCVRGEWRRRARAALTAWSRSYGISSVMYGGLCRRRQVPWHDIGLPAAAYELIIDGHNREVGSDTRAPAGTQRSAPPPRARFTDSLLRAENRSFTAIRSMWKAEPKCHLAVHCTSCPNA